MSLPFKLHMTIATLQQYCSLYWEDLEVLGLHKKNKKTSCYVGDRSDLLVNHDIIDSKLHNLMIVG